MRLIHFVINISQKCMSSADVWKYWDSVLGHKDCLAANSKSTGPPQKSADDRNCSVDSMTNFRWVAEHRCWWPVTSAVSVQLSIKYGGAVLWRHQYMSTASLNLWVCALRREIHVRFRHLYFAHFWRFCAGIQLLSRTVLQQRFVHILLRYVCFTVSQMDHGQKIQFSSCIKSTMSVCWLDFNLRYIHKRRAASFKQTWLYTCPECQENSF